MPIMPDESFADLHFPAAGIDSSFAFAKQPNKPVAGGIYARTTPIAVNVRGYEALTQRVRGGSRAGLSRQIAGPVVADWLIQELTVIVFMAPGAVG